jgi:hypothetical protein
MRKTKNGITIVVDIWHQKVHVSFEGPNMLEKASLLRHPAIPKVKAPIRQPRQRRKQSRLVEYAKLFASKLVAFVLNDVKLRHRLCKVESILMAHERWDVPIHRHVSENSASEFPTNFHHYMF